MYPITFTVFSFLCADYNLYKTDSALPLVLNVSYASLHVYKKLQCKAILFAFTCEVGTNNLLCILVPCLHTIAISWLIQSQLRCFFPLISGHFLFRLWKGCCNACWSHMTLTCHSGQHVLYYYSIRFIARCHTLPSFFKWMDF